MADMKVENPGEIVFTLTYRMSLSNWEALVDQFKKNSGDFVEWPASDFVSEIKDMTNKATKTFYPD